MSEQERPQQAHIRAVRALMAHAATHSPAWRLPCRTCDDLRAAEDRARSVLMEER